MKRRHAVRIRYAILKARYDWCTPLTAEHLSWFETWAEPKSWLLDGRLEERTYWRERQRLYQRSMDLINETLKGES